MKPLLLVFSVVLPILPTLGQNCATDSLKQVLQPTSPIADRISSAIALSTCFEYTDYDTVVFYAELANQLSQEQKNNQWKCNSCLRLGTAYAQTSRLEEAESIFLQADSLCVALEDRGKLFNNLAILYNRQNQLGQAEQMLLQSLAIEQELGQKSREVRILLNLSSITKHQLDYERALSYASSALQINDSLQETPLLAVNYTFLAEIYNETRDYDKALEYIDKAIPLLEEKEMETRLGGAFSNKATILSNLGQLPAAIDFGQRAADKYVQTNDLRNLAGAQTNLGDLYLAVQAYDQAEAILKANLALCDSIGDFLNLSRSQALYGRVLAYQGQADQAYRYAYDALALTKQRALISSRRTVYLQLIQIDSILQRPSLGVKHYREFSRFKDTLIDLEKREVVAKLQTELETAEKEKQILSLANANEIQALKLSQQQQRLIWGTLALVFFLVLSGFLIWQRNRLRKTQQQLSHSLEEKETLLKEIHHRVKNNLQLITSLLNLQADGESEQTVEEFLYKGRTRVKSMALIHEHLYRSNNLANIDMQSYVQELVDSIFDSFGAVDSNITYQLEAQPTELDIDKAIPLGLIINELVSNSLKHAFENQPQGQIQIKLKNQANQVDIRIQDNGKGFLSTENPNSLGLQLVRILVRQLKGSFHLHADQGTQADISFSLSPIS